MAPSIPNKLLLNLRAIILNDLPADCKRNRHRGSEHWSCATASTVSMDEYLTLVKERRRQARFFDD